MPINNIHASFRQFVLPIERLRPNPENVRQHDERNVQIIADALERFGQDQPLVATNNYLLVKGHGRLLAAKKLGWTEIACVLVPDGKATATARAIADQRASDTSTWDFAALAQAALALHADGQDIHDCGWAPGELAFILPDTKPKTAQAPAVRTTAPRMEGLRLTPEQRQAFEDAYKVIRKMVGGEVSEGRALELICAEFMSGVR
jgi:hypothetical protein